MKSLYDKKIGVRLLLLQRRIPPEAGGRNDVNRGNDPTKDSSLGGRKGVVED
jgi:hypothetical protein